MDKLVVIKFNSALGTSMGFGGPKLDGAQLLGVVDPTTCQLAALVALQSSSIFRRACVCGRSYCVCCCCNHHRHFDAQVDLSRGRGQILLGFGGGSGGMAGRVKEQGKHWAEYLQHGNAADTMLHGGA